MKNMQLRELVLCALFIALITVGTFVRIPVGTDVYTLQFLFSVVDFATIWKPVALVFVGVGMLVGVGGSLTAIRKFLQV